MSTVYKIAWSEIEQVAKDRPAGYIDDIEELGTVYRDDTGAAQYVLLPAYYYDAIKAKYSGENGTQSGEPIPNFQPWFKISPNNNPLP